MIEKEEWGRSPDAALRAVESEIAGHPERANSDETAEAAHQRLDAAVEELAAIQVFSENEGEDPDAVVHEYVGTDGHPEGRAELVGMEYALGHAGAAPLTLEALAHEPAKEVHQAALDEIEAGRSPEAVEELMDDVLEIAEQEQNKVDDVIHKWQWSENGLIQDPAYDTINMLEASGAIRKVQEGQVQDRQIAAIIEQARESWQRTHEQDSRDPAAQSALDGYIAGAKSLTDQGRPIPPMLEAEINRLHEKIAQAPTPQFTVENDFVGIVSSELADREADVINRAVQERVDADTLPWDMPHADTLPDVERSVARELHDLVIQENPHTLPSSPDDIFAVPSLLGRSDKEAVEDMKLLNDAGIDKGSTYTRQDLQHAGVFFINRVGEGEQPIFGATIEDEQGVFNVRERAFLTRDEFDRVYRYQQEHNMGLGSHDAADVQMDMVMYGVESGHRKRKGINKELGHGRENKRGSMRSPFVDSPFVVPDSGFGVMIDMKDHTSDGGSRRMNTLSLHLINGHPDYPGVSEMFNPETTAVDQKYISPAEFIDTLYCVPTTEKEAFEAVKHGLPTRRERVWTGS